MKYLVDGLLICSAAASVAVAAAPDGWLLAGNKPANYDTGIDRSAVFARNSAHAAFLASSTVLITGVVGSVCTTGISREFLRGNCKRVGKAKVPAEWRRAIGH